MTVLVIIDWNLKRFGDCGYDNLIERIKPDSIKIIHSPECDFPPVGDLIGDTLYRINLLKGVDITSHPHRSITQSVEFKKGTFDEMKIWGTEASNLMKNLDLDIGRHVERGDLHICATGGSSFVAGCLLTVGEVTGSHIWTLLPTEADAFIPEAVEITVNSTFEMPQRVGFDSRRFGGKESGMLSRMAEYGDGKSEWIRSDAISSVKYDLPQSQGLSTVAKSLEESGMIDRRDADPVEYRLTDIGLIHAAYQLSKNEVRLDPIPGSESAVIIFWGGRGSPDEESKWCSKYLIEHGLLGAFSKYALVAIEYGDNDARAMKIAERIQEVVPIDDLLGGEVKSISNLMFHDEAGYYDSLRRLLNVIKDASEGYRRKCTLVIDRVPSHLIAPVLRYCRSSDISVISCLRRRSSEGVTGPTLDTKLDKPKHRLRLPEDHEIEVIRRGIKDTGHGSITDGQQVRRVLATILEEKDSGGRGEIESRDLGSYNLESSSGDLLFSDSKTGDKQRSRGITSGEEHRLIHREGKELLSLTASGEVLARMTLMRGR